MSHNAKPADTDQELLRAFEVFDKDGSGTITTSELKDVLRSLGENLTDEELDEMVKLTDKNGDGVIDCKWLFGGSCERQANDDDTRQTMNLPA